MSAGGATRVCLYEVPLLSATGRVLAVAKASVTRTFDDEAAVTQLIDAGGKLHDTLVFHWGHTRYDVTCTVPASWLADGGDVRYRHPGVTATPTRITEAERGTDGKLTVTSYGA